AALRYLLSVRDAESAHWLFRTLEQVYEAERTIGPSDNTLSYAVELFDVLNALAKRQNARALQAVCPLRNRLMVHLLQNEFAMRYSRGVMPREGIQRAKIILARFAALPPKIRPALLKKAFIDYRDLDVLLFTPIPVDLFKAV